MKLPDLPVKLPDFPRPVLISLGAIIGSVVMFGVLFPTLGASRDNAIADNGRLKASIAKASQDIATARDDYKFVTDNQAHFEDLIQSDRLVPHTPRDAIKQLQALRAEHGLTTLTWEFSVVADKAPLAATSQAKTDAYRLSVETITLKVGSPLDGQIYRFLLGLTQNFPGSAVVTSIDIQRAPKVTGDILSLVSKGLDANLVRGEVKVLWRTAQANDTGKKPQ